MSQGQPGTPPERVRVTGPARRRTSGGRDSALDVETPLGGVYLGSLMRVQLRLATGVLVLLGLLVGALPALFHLAPGLGSVHVLGLPLPWLLLGVLVYPVLLGLGWVFVRRAERNESDFAELVGEGET